MRLDYETAGFYDGNIGKQEWKSNIDNVKRSFTYSYDGASRIKTGFYASDNVVENYSLNNVNYDFNGNITNLSRNGWRSNNTFGLVDNLNYAYQSNSNKIQAVTDASIETASFADVTGTTDYMYSLDGSLTSDANKGITVIEYNYLKKPRRVVRNGIEILYQYAANGTKLRETIGTDFTDYLGNIIKKNNILYQIGHDEGRIIEGQYEYNIKDHLGNLRVAFRDSLGIAKITQANSYGVWGEGLPTLSYLKSTWKADNFKFTGKESLQGTGFVDFGARWYDNIVPRFTTIDPLSELSRRFSPTVYANGNPLRFIDPDGMQAQTIYDLQGNKHDVGDNDLTNVYQSSSDDKESKSDDVNIHGSDGKTLTIKAPGPDINVNIDAKIGSNRTIDIGLKNIEDLAVGYQLSGTVGYQIGMGAYGGINMAKVYYFNSEYGYYWYTYAGGEMTNQIGFAADASASVTSNIFAMVNVEKGRNRFNPNNFIGEASALGVSGSLKLLGGLGGNVSIFSSGPWRGINVGLSTSVGYGINMGSLFSTQSYSYPLTPVIPTSKRTWADIIINNLNH
jgi:RHS repeat-associated protein